MTAIPASLASAVEVKSTSSPRNRNDPSSRGCKPATTLIRVDLPAPFSPTTAWMEPGCTLRSPSARATTEPNVLRTPASSRTGVGSGDVIGPPRCEPSELRAPMDDRVVTRIIVESIQFVMVIIWASSRGCQHVRPLVEEKPLYGGQSWRWHRCATWRNGPGSPRRRFPMPSTTRSAFLPRLWHVFRPPLRSSAIFATTPLASCGPAPIPLSG